ncbi:hypothetical protein CYCD_19980 [Tenuifilaceae bacterium CYCD]|nr:hypothetical protein CYCD_19980 [Tenuifilaceae bacterium CYCD]
MKKNIFNLITILLLGIISCKKEDNTLPTIPYIDPNLKITVYPKNTSTNNSFRVRPFLAFNKRFNYTYTYPSGAANCFKLIYDSTYISDASGQPLQLPTNFNSTKDTLFFNTDNSFTANSNYSIKFFYHIEVKRDIDSDFEILMKNEVPFQGKFESSFEIKNYIFSISTSYLEYAYPYPYQYHFLKDETPNGELKFNNDQENDLYFKDATYNVRFTTPSGESWESNATYNVSNRKLEFQIPRNLLTNQTIYKLEYLVSSPQMAQTVFLTYHFRTSKFNTFEEKMSTAKEFAYYNSYVSQGVYILMLRFKLDEGFDVIEAMNYTGLLRFEASIDTNMAYFKKYNNFYTGLSSRGYFLNKRNDRLPAINIPPSNGITITCSVIPLLTQSQISQGFANDYGEKVIWFESKDLQLTFSEDVNYVRNIIISNFVNCVLPAWESDIVNNSFYSSINIGTYIPFEIMYTTGDKLTSTIEDSSTYYFTMK